MKRFYKEVSVSPSDGGWQVTLDGRAVKTVKGAPQIAPNEDLAQALAAEWEAQGEKIDPATFPLRDLADYALDIVTPAPSELVDKLLAYGDTDTLLYRADPDEPLYARQQEVWEPIVAGFEEQIGAELTRVSGIIHRPQSETVMAALRAQLTDKSPFLLAALEVLTSLSASLIVALKTGEAPSQEDALTLWQAASLEEEWQAELWGRDEEAEERRAKRTSDFLNAWKAARLAVTS